MVASPRKTVATVSEPAAPSAQVVRLPTPCRAPDPGGPADGAAALRRAARDLADGASRMAVCADGMREALAILAAEHRALHAQMARAHRIQHDAARIARAIESGDLDAMLALRTELAG